MASLAINGRLNQSNIAAEWRVLADEPFIELRLSIDWNERHKILKLSFNLPSTVSNRIDGIPGLYLDRESDGKETPLRDWTRLTLQSGQMLGVVCPDVFAADADPHRLRLTLLRSCVMANHNPFDLSKPGPFRLVYSDRGSHHFRFRFTAGPDVNIDNLNTQATMFQRPPIIAELTRGMPAAEQ